MYLINFPDNFAIALKMCADSFSMLCGLVKYANETPLSAKHRDHDLGGKWKHHRECHIKPDWLLIYRLEKEKLCLVRTGSHSDLFE